MKWFEYRSLAAEAALLSVIVHLFALWGLKQESHTQILSHPKRLVEIQVNIIQSEKPKPLIPQRILPTPKRVKRHVISEKKHYPSPKATPLHPLKTSIKKSVSLTPRAETPLDNPQVMAITAKADESPNTLITPSETVNEHYKAVEIKSTLPNYNAAYLDNPKPDYPLKSRQLEEEGTVILKVHVTPEGRADEVKVHKSSGSYELDEAARKTVLETWRFIPAKRGQEAVAASVLIPLIFKMPED